METQDPRELQGQRVPREIKDRLGLRDPTEILDRRGQSGSLAPRGLLEEGERLVHPVKMVQPDLQVYGDPRVAQEVQASPVLQGP
jgi:hypothetical protein